VEARYLVAAVAVGALIAAIRLFGALRRARHDNTALQVELAELEHELRQTQLTHRERLHDARSVLTGLAGGIRVLTRNTSADRRDLQRMLVCELDRAQSLLDPNAPEPITEFDLGEALAPVLLAHRLDNQHINCDLDSITVRGRPRATAAVLDNVLRNAGVHAPGAAVTINTRVEEDWVVVFVGDDGPGIPRSECVDVLRPGVRGSTARGAGSGLGLHSAATTMTSQHGYLRVDRGVSGGTLVTFALPLSPEALPRLSTRRSVARLTEAS